MKKLLSLLLVVSMLLCVTACNKQSADKYCTHCGSGMAKSDAFCPECGKAVNGTATDGETTSSTEITSSATSPSSSITEITTSTTTTTVKKETTTKKTTQATSEQKTTTTKNPTTTTTTKASPSTTKPTTPTTTAHKHTYLNYVCTGCGNIDKAHAYEYVIEWVLQNGETDGSHVSYIYTNNGTRYSLCYDSQSDYLYICSSEYLNGKFVYCSLSLDLYSYFSSIEDTAELFGYIPANQFTSSYPITYQSYTGDNSIKYDFIELSRLSVDRLLEWLDWMLYYEDVGISLYDLGFTAY